LKRDSKIYDVLCLRWFYFRLENIIKDKYKYEIYIQNEKCALYIILKNYNLMLIFILIINYFLKHFF